MNPQQPYQPYPQQGSGQYPYPQQAPTYGYPGDGYPGMYPSPQIVVRGDRNGLGTAALVLGITAAVFSVIPIVGLIAWPLSITGIILGFIGLSRVNQGEATNRGVTIGGLATSGAALAICFVWLIFLGFAGTASTANRTGVPTANSVPTASASPASKTDPQSSAATAPAKPAGPATSFGDGTWVVGEDIQPGTYRSPGAKPGLLTSAPPAPTSVTQPTARSSIGRRRTLGSRCGSRCRVRRSRWRYTAARPSPRSPDQAPALRGGRQHY